MSGYPDDRGCGPNGLPEGAVVIDKPFRANRLLAGLREVLEEPSDGSPDVQRARVPRSGRRGVQRNQSR